MALLSFVKNNNHNISAAYFDHATAHGKDAKNFVTEYCNSNKIPLKIGTITSPKPSSESWEEYWRNQRYAFLWSLPGRVATAHHLNDVVETYLWGCAHGNPKIIFYRQLRHNKMTNVVRPLLLTPKDELVSWCQRHMVPYIVDPSNGDDKYTRNKIRIHVVPKMLEVNPGLFGVVKEMLYKRLKETCACNGGVISCDKCQADNLGLLNSTQVPEN